MFSIGIDARLTYYRGGGISTYIRRLIEALGRLDQENAYTVLYSRKDRARIGQRFAAAKLWTPAHHRIERLTLSLELLPLRLDLLHSPDFIPPYRGARRHVITVHDLTFLHYPDYLTADSRRYYNDQIRAACQHADAILAVSEATRSDLITMLGISEGKISVQPHGVLPAYRPLSPEEYLPVLESINAPAGAILHVGTWEPRKNIDGLLRGYKMLLERLPDAPPVLLVGRPGWLFSDVQQRIDALNLGDRILWRSDVEDDQLPAVYAASRLLVSPSFYEGFGMPALEAMACGCVPIVSNRSSLPEVVDEVGALITPEDPESIAAALERGLGDQTWWQEQRQAGLLRARSYTWERSAQIALETYTSVL